MAYKLAIPEHTERQIDKCISYIVNTLRNPPAAEAVLDDIEHAYDLLEKMAESLRRSLSAIKRIPETDIGET